MNEKGWKTFEEDLKKLLAIQFKVNELTPDTSLSIIDSLAVVEILNLVEEHFDVELTFEKVRAAKTYTELTEMIVEQGMVDQQ